MAASSLAINRQILADTMPVANLSLDPNNLSKFVDPLPIPEIARSSGTHPSPENATAKLPYYRLTMREVEAKLHRDLPATRLWVYGAGHSPDAGVHVPGPTIEARKGEGIIVEWANELPPKHFLPIDHHLCGAEKNQPEVRAVVHLHGAKAPPESDGYPEHWTVPGQSQIVYYPNLQDAAVLWYHDHAMGINRLNIYAGLLGLYIVRDAEEDALNLPRGEYEIPLALCDRQLRTDGQLDYPVSGKADAPWVSEAFGNAMLVNGKLFPYLNVEARKYRFRVLNGSNGRFYRLSLDKGLVYQQIGTDQGLLPKPVQTRRPLIAPGERVDLVVDFSQHRGEQILLKSDSFELMQFRVANHDSIDGSTVPAELRPIPEIREDSAATTRRLTLSDVQNDVGESMRMLLNNTPWHMPVTEKPILDSTEIWEFVNLTDDSHPIHLHLVRFQILDRRRFDVFEYQAHERLRFTGPTQPPDAGEAGWKDTVRVDPGTCTRIIIPFTGYAGRYVWHCHLLEHEDNEMMRPYKVIRPEK